MFNATLSNISVISWRSVLVKEESGESHRFDVGDWTSFENHRADTSPLSNLSLKVQGENTLLLPLCDQINVFVQWIMVTEDDHSAATLDHQI